MKASRWGVAMVLLVAVLAPAAGAEAGPAHIAVAARPAGGGVMVGWHEEGNSLDGLRAHEAALGKRFAVVRYYSQWKLPGRRVDELVGEGRLVLSSHKPPSPADGGWATVASGAEDATIRALARAYRDYRTQVVFIFHHEPHDDASDLKGGRYGTAADFLAAWRRVHAVFVAEGAHVSAGGNVLFGYSGTTPWILRGTPDGSADPLYPGDRYVDVLAHDRYNWASCRGDDWEEFAEIWAPVVRMAAARGKELIIGETGSAPAGGRRNDWFRGAARYMKEDPLARRWLVGFSYYHSFHSTCHWDFLNQGTDGLLGWVDAFTRDPYFTGTPFAVGGAGPGAGVGPLPPGVGYWLHSGDGGVFAFGDAAYFGSTGGVPLNQPIVGLEAARGARGYWLVARDGGVFAFGDAGYFGSTGGMALRRPIVGLAATPGGDGYWVAAADGGVFAFGAAPFLGSAGGVPLRAPAIAVEATPSGRGYWITTGDGGIFAYGDAIFAGSTGALALNQPIVAMAATPSGRGYWLAAADGGIFAFGDAGFWGSLGGTALNQPVVGLEPTDSGRGYYLVAADGGVFAFGDAVFAGSTGSLRLNAPVLGMAATRS